MTARLPSSISIGQTATAVAVATTRPGHVIGIIGYTGAGKSTTAEVLKADGYTMASFGALIRAEVAQAWGISVNRMASSTGAKRQPQTLLAFGRCIDPYFKHAMARAGEVMGKPRSLIDTMQAWGDFRRSESHDYWLNAMIKHLVQQHPIHALEKVVLTGVCTPAEAAQVKKWGGTLIRIHSPRVQEVSDHMTQDLHLIKADELVYADGTLKQAQHDLMQIVKGLQR